MSVPQVFTDANVLYSSALRDIPIELALDGIIALRWSPAVLDELVRALVRTRPDYSTAKGLRLAAAMTGALMDVLVIPPDATAPKLTLPDPNDVHVRATACHAECTMILTFNLKHFPADQLAFAGRPIEAVHPDAFLLTLLTSDAPAVLAVVERVRQKLTKPPMTVAAYADSLARSGLPGMAELLRCLLPA